jgi:hypothetical protein
MLVILKQSVLVKHTPNTCDRSFMKRDIPYCSLYVHTGTRLMGHDDTTNYNSLPRLQVDTLRRSWRTVTRYTKLWFIVVYICHDHPNTINYDAATMINRGGYLWYHCGKATMIGHDPLAPSCTIYIPHPYNPSAKLFYLSNTPS